ncbi:hypothetical protein EJ07DRAFT_159498 [Lizonia empirigonia]|nr:hypothetical protein EJ07DRAFT_159498 [Lizonia empirigonia]
MADVDFQAANIYLRPPPNFRILLVARLLPERGIFERKGSPNYHWASVSTDEPCKVIIVADPYVKRIWVAWSSDFVKALPSLKDAKARAKMPKVLDCNEIQLIVKHAKGWLPNWNQGSCHHTGEVHQKLREMAHDRSRPAKEQFLLGSEVREMLWKDDTENADDWVPISEWRSTYDKMVQDMASDNNADSKDVHTGRNAGRKAEAKVKISAVAKAGERIVKTVGTGCRTAKKSRSAMLTPRKRTAGTTGNDLTPDDDADWIDVEDEEEEDSDRSAFDPSDVD